jgi:hypothetical protein
MTPLLRRTDMRLFMAAIFGIGVLRFALTLAGLSNDVVKNFSMTAIMLVGTVYFALKTESHKERLKAAYLLTLPYMVVEVAAIGYTWATGRVTIFHAPEYNLGTSPAFHTIGHLLGGLTWEPLMGFVLMEILWLASTGISRFTGTNRP